MEKSLGQRFDHGVWRLMFITFEGGEGTGKSTQVSLLAEKLKAHGRDVVVTREPGGTPEGEKLRSLLVSGDTDTWIPDEETLLNFAARSAHLRKKIRPALAQGKIVICDRFIDSTAVYQVYAGNPSSLQFVQYLIEQIVRDTIPSITFVLDIDPAVGVMRSRNRMAGLKIISEEIAEDFRTTLSEESLNAMMEIAGSASEDRFERKGIEFHKRVREGFQTISRQDPERCRLIDASKPIEVVADEIWALLANLWLR